jgi:hypothetical protein
MPALAYKERRILKFNTRKNNRPKTIAPRLADGRCRIPFGHGLPPEIKDGLREIAANEGKSMSWVMEEVIIRYFHLKRPKYVDRKRTK